MASELQTFIAEDFWDSVLLLLLYVITSETHKATSFIQLHSSFSTTREPKTRITYFKSLVEF